MDRYRRMAILAAVVENRSLRRAARSLGLTPSAVSQPRRRRKSHLASVTVITRLTIEAGVRQASTSTIKLIVPGPQRAGGLHHLTDLHHD